MRQRPINIESNDNTLFTTSRCNNRCIMCCQPPTTNNDIEYLFEENLQRIHCAPKDIKLIGITGGEPTLLGEKLVLLIEEIRLCLPNTNILLLTNGRKLSKESYTKTIAKAGGEHLFVDVELHSDYSVDHDYIAGHNGAYRETLLGLYNLAINDVEIELRIIICKQNYRRLLNIAEFIHKNLPFVGSVIFMGMEYIGYVITNSEIVWVEPFCYQKELQEAVVFLSGWGYNVNIYNIPLCLLPNILHPYAKKSISDWKNYFPLDCNNCMLKNDCCGLFSTSLQQFKNLSPFQNKCK